MISWGRLECVFTHNILVSAGSGLGWHEDDAQYKGAYIFYAHPEWKPNWGGELCVINTPVNSSAGLSEQTYNASEEVLRMSGITGGTVGPEFDGPSVNAASMILGSGHLFIQNPIDL